MKHPLLLLEDLGDEAKLIYFISSLERKLGAGRRFFHIFLLGFGLNYQFPLYHIQGGGVGWSVLQAKRLHKDSDKMGQKKF
jgi:hypothetical protein